MPKQKKVPLRQCIACRELKEKKTMLRIVRDREGKISLDFTGKAAGRGAYVCDSATCIAKVKKSRLLDRVFACRVEESVYSSIEEEYLDRKS